MMETVAQSITKWAYAHTWFRGFLKEELAPFPGRLAMVARMVLAATVMMIIFMTFKIPDAPYAALFGLIISREDPQTTITAVKTDVIAYAYSVVFILIGALLFAGDPMLRLLWVIAALFMGFFCLSAMTNYTAAARFGWIIVITIPIWDQHIPPQAKVTATLWVVGALTLASVTTVAFELAFEALWPSRDLLRSIAERLSAVEELLCCYADGRPVDQDTVSKLARLSMLGTSRLRRVLLRSTSSLNYGERMGAVVALVGRAVDLAAALVQLNPQFSSNDRQRIDALVQNLATIRAALEVEMIPAPVLPLADGQYSSSVPLLEELEKSIGMIPEAFADLPLLSNYAPLSPGHTPPARLFVPDAFTNPEHVKFALKGCLAASLCYVIYTALDWSGIATAVTTCFLTALSTIGSSHQKQALRFTGALAGGVAGVLAQIFILPGVESIAGFTALFLVVSFVAGWVVSSGPRLSYFGVQFAYAFYIINLSEFTIQISLTPGRDRVIGILLGLAIMWLAFDQLSGAPAIVGMKRATISLLRSLAKLAGARLSNNLQFAIEQTYAFRETVNAEFNNVRSLADGALFEFGPTRQQDLNVRRRFLSWQPELRMLFISCITLLKYRLQLPGFELPDAVRLAQRDFEGCLARTLESMANRLEGKPTGSPNDLEQALTRLRDAIRDAIRSSGTAAAERLVGQLNTFSALFEKITRLTLSLYNII